MNIEEIINKAPLIRPKEVQNIYGCNAISVQVAGTNGKGSTCAFLYSILYAHGKRVGVYTSPHIKDICERIAVNGENIDRSRFEDLLCEIDNREPGMCKSDLMFFSAVQYFNEQQVDVAIFETGLGGAKDSATLIHHNYGIITQIGLDHIDLLGDTVEKITVEKSGIIKEGMCVYSYPNRTNFIIEDKCKHMNAVYKGVQKDDVISTENGFDICCHDMEVKEVKLRLKGDFQGYNVTVALLCARDILGEEFDLSKAIKAVSDTVVYGRMSVLKENPLVLADVSHNPDGINELCKYIDGLNGKKIAIVSIQRTKDCKEMMKRLRCTFDIIIGMVADCGAWSVDELDADITVQSVEEAYDLYLEEKSDVIVFCGSFAIVKKAVAMFA